jgi:hypothetical protein
MIIKNGKTRKDARKIGINAITPKFLRAFSKFLHYEEHYFALFGAISICCGILR